MHLHKQHREFVLHLARCLLYLPDAACSTHYAGGRQQFLGGPAPGARRAPCTAAAPPTHRGGAAGGNPGSAAGGGAAVGSGGAAWGRALPLSAAWQTATCNCSG